MNSIIILCGSNFNLFSPEIITAFSTVILALITAFYAYWTYQMVKINKKEFEITNRPYVSVMTMDQKIDNNKLVFSVAIKNSGKIPAIITSSEVIAYNEDKTENKSLGKSITTLIIDPGEYIGKDIITLENYSSPIKLTFVFEINYKSPIQKKDNYMTKYNYAFDSTKNLKLIILDTELK
ncbi:MAG: hypothetical protein ABFC55_07375 [Tenuifilaceae bacterium]